MSDMDALLWFQTVGEGDQSTHTVLIGYDEATFMGIGGDGSVRGQEVQVAMGDKSAQNTIIFANSLYLQPGANYEFPGKNLTIIARRLGMSSAAAGNATITVDGPDAAPATPQTDPKPSKDTPPAQPHYGWQEGTPGNPGTSGANGANGHQGSSAGTITLMVYEQIKPGSSDTFPLVLSAKGGKGTSGNQGQDGGDGQDGGPGGNDGASTNARGGDGGRGGNGGVGGIGGEGGAGGKVTFNIAKPDTAFKAYAAVDVSRGTDGIHGLGGKDGSPGNPGLGWDAHGNTANKGSRGNPGQTGGIQGLAIHPNGTIFGVGADLMLHTKAALTSSWAQVSNSGAVTAVAVGPDGTIYGIGTDHKVYSRPKLDNSWTQVPNSGEVIALTVMGNSTLVGVGTDHRVYLRREQNWVLAMDSATLGMNVEFLGVHALPSGWVIFIDAKNHVCFGYGIAATGEYTMYVGPTNREIVAVTHTADGKLLGLGTDNWLYVSEFQPPATSGSPTMTDWARIFGDGTFAGVTTHALADFAAAISPDQVAMTLANLRFLYLTRLSLTSFAPAGDDSSLSGLQQGWTSSSNGILNPNGDGTLFLAKREETDKCLKQYFPDNTEIGKAVDDYMDAIQGQNQLVLLYNEHVVKLLKAQADKIQATDTKDRLSVGLEALDSPGLMQLSRLASHAYTDQLHDLIEQLYIAGRAYCCLALKPSACMNVLSAVDSLNVLDANVLATALEKLNGELNAFDAELTENVPAEVPLTLSAMASGPTKPFITALQRSREVDMFLDPDTVSLAGANELVGKYDIRVRSASVYLIGAGSPNTDIHVNLTSGTRCQVQGYRPDQSVNWFDMKPTTTFNVFRYDDAGVLKDTSSPQPELIEMKWGGEDGTKPLSVPLRSLFTQWTISVPDPSLDLSHVTEIRLVFDAVCRAKPTNPTHLT